MEEDWGIGRIWGKPESEKRMSRMCSGVRLVWGLNLARNFWKGVRGCRSKPTHQAKKYRFINQELTQKPGSTGPTRLDGDLANSCRS